MSEGVVNVDGVRGTCGHVKQLTRGSTSLARTSIQTPALHSHRRSAMWRLDAGRAILVGGFAVFTLFRLPPILMIVILGFVLGSVETIFDNAATALVPEMVDSNFLVRANGRLISSQTLSSQFVGPALGGILFATARFVPVAIDALSFLAAAVLVATLPVRKKSASEHPETTDAGSLRSEIMERLRFLKHQPVLLLCTIVAVPLYATSGVLTAVLVLYVKNLLHAESIGYGLLFSAFALGSLLGSAMAPRLLSRFRSGEVLAGTIPLTALSFVSLYSTNYVGTAAASVSILGVAVGLWNVTSISLRQTLTPGHLRGRVNSAYGASISHFENSHAVPEVSEVNSEAPPSVHNADPDGAITLRYHERSAALRENSSGLSRTVSLFDAAHVKIEGPTPEQRQTLQQYLESAVNEFRIFLSDYTHRVSREEILVAEYQQDSSDQEVANFFKSLSESFAVSDMGKECAASAYFELQHHKLP